MTFVLGGGEDVVPWRQLHHEAKAVAADLQARGIRPGDKVALTVRRGDQTRTADVTLGSTS